MVFDLSHQTINYTSSLGQPVTFNVYNYASQVWNGLMAIIGNPIGVAAAMGNFQVESYNVPFCRQGDVPPSQVSIDYTNSVDNGSTSVASFVNNGPGGGGYGLAQWTWYTRKQNMIDIAKANGWSIGSIETAMGILSLELTGGYSGVLSAMQSATDLKSASDTWLHNYEAPGDQGEIQQKIRHAYAEWYYNAFAQGGVPSPPQPDPGNPQPQPPDPQNPQPPTQGGINIDKTYEKRKVGEIFTIIITPYADFNFLSTSDNIELLSISLQGYATFKGKSPGRGFISFYAKNDSEIQCIVDIYTPGTTSADKARKSMFYQRRNFFLR